MDAGRWHRIEALYHEALTKSQSDREAFLLGACGDDVELRHEVESLVDHARESESLLRTAQPAAETAPISLEPDPAVVGQMWGEFKLLKHIDKGGFGRVYLAHDDALAREIALKVVRPTNAAGLATALREGQMLARVRHRNVVTVFSAKQIGEEVGIAMELIRGRHLSDVVRQNGPMSAEEATPIGISLCQALAAVHGVSLLHRDIKAHNVMRESGGRTVLMDFGASRDAGPSAPGRGDLTGTLLYLAPEVIDHKPASRASDIYSLGVLLFYLVTGTYPVEGAILEDVALAHAAGIRKRLADIRPDLSSAFVRLVERAMAPRPEDRYQSAGEMQADLTDVMASMSGSFRSAFDPARLPSGAGAAGTMTAEQTVAMTIVARLQYWGIVVACASVGVLAIGFLTTKTFDNALSLEGFTDHSLWEWWGHGAMALIPLVLISALILGFSWMVVTAWHLIQRIFGWGAREGRPGLRARLADRLMPAGDLNNVARLLVVGQFVGIAGTIWLFGDLLWAMVVQVNTGDKRIWGVLDSDNLKLYLYHWAVSGLLAGVILAWAALLRARRAGGRLDTPTLAVGGVMGLLTLVMATAPWQLFYSSSAPRVDIGEERCYETGKRGETMLLFCPDAEPPRNRRLSATDPTLVNLGSSGRIFASPAQAKKEREGSK